MKQSAPREPERKAPPTIREAIEAATAGDVERIQSWLQKGGDPNQYDDEGWTPLLAAVVRGRASNVELLLGNRASPANPDIPHRISGALPIHFAGHSGSIPVAKLLLARRPEHLNAVWDLNGHTLFLQAVFYDHRELTQFALEQGADTSATTVRGLGGMELAQQFQNQALMELIRPYDSSAEAKAAKYRALLKRIERITPKDELERQKLSDALILTITDGLGQVASDVTAGERTLTRVRELVEDHGVDLNRLGGALLQPPLTVVVTGNNGSPANPHVAGLRSKLADYLLQSGADPTVLEMHPMGVDAIIRAAVFNHLEILKAMGRRLTPQQLSRSVNNRPLVNGLTALHDSVLRASTAGPDRLEGYLQQIRWLVASGARSDIEDYSGRTQRSIAEGVSDPLLRERLLAALGA